MNPKLRVRELEGSLRFYRNLLSVAGTSKAIQLAAFLGLVETEAKIAKSQYPFTMKPKWPKIGTEN